MRIYCPTCKTEHESTTRVCTKCGTDLSVIETLPVPPDAVSQKIDASPAKSVLEFTHGQDFGRRYRIIEEIGKGGMGKIYKAYDKELNRVIALKMIQSEFCRVPEAVELFKKELLLAQQITHKNVIRIHDIDEVDGIKYISMPFIEGLTLRDYIQTSRNVSPGTAMEIIQQICNGLQAAHEMGILHRDLKTRNIMIDHKGQVYILDFGIATSLVSEENRKADGRIIGTLEYMSPEQAQGKPADQRSDIYSLGIIMYELLTGRVPFSGTTTSEVLQQQVSVAPKTPSAFNADIPQFMEKIILKCLEKNPADRYQSVQELIHALAEISLQSTIPLDAIRPRTILPGWVWGILAVIIITTGFALYTGIDHYRKIRSLPDAHKQPVITDAAGQSEPVPQREMNSIAVLPFSNMSSEPDQDYFCDGMTEQLITNLANMKDLKVIARTSVMMYKNTTKDIRQIAKELDVKNILEGSVRKSKEQIRITAQLINATDGSHIWARDYDRELKDVFKVQDEVSQKIAEALKVAVGKPVIDTAQKSQPHSIEAYNYFLKAKYAYLNKATASLQETDLAEAIQYAEKSIELDSEYALGYSMLATLYVYQFWFSNKEESLKKAEYYAGLASRYDPSGTETLRARFWVHFMKNEFDESFALIKKLIDENPKDFENNYLLEMFYGRVGMPNDAIKYATRAIELSPMSFDVYGDRAVAYRDLGDKVNHIRDIRTCLSLQPESMTCRIFYALYLLWIKDLPAADTYIAELEKGELSSSATRGSIKFMRALYYAKHGDREKALALYEDVDIYAELGMAKKAVPLLKECLETAACDAYPSYDRLLHEPYYENIRNTPEFQQLLMQQKPISDEMIRKYRIKDMQ